MAKNFINKAMNMGKKLAVKVGQSKFTYNFIYNFLDTFVTKAIGVVLAITAIVGCTLFKALPLTQYWPFYWNIPEWTMNTTMADISVTALLVFFAVGIPTAIIGICYVIANNADTVKASETK